MHNKQFFPKQIKINDSFDTLTKLYNKKTFLELVKINFNNDNKAILFININHFKDINDLYGHKIGNIILYKVSKRMKQFKRNKEIIGRFDSDKFIFLLNNIKNKKEVEEFSKNLKKKIKEKIYIKEINENIKLRINIGISLFPKDSKNILDVIKYSEIAVFQSKNSLKKYKFFNKKDQEKRIKELKLEKELLKSIKKENFEMYYQPQTIQGKIIGVESLIRWNHNGNFIYPDLFISLAEKKGYIVDLGKIIIKKCFSQMAKWKSENIKVGKMAINLSVYQLLDPNLINDLKFYLKLYKVSANDFDLEITENVFINNMKKIKKILKRLKSLGFLLSIDDFGTGYSSLSYIQDLPIDKLKIDKSFVMKLNKKNNLENIHIIRTIISLSKTLNFKIIAEGVETEKQNEILLNEGVEIIQGYYFSKPLNSKDLEKYIINNL